MPKEEGIFAKSTSMRKNFFVLVILALINPQDVLSKVSNDPKSIDLILIPSGSSENEGRPRSSSVEAYYETECSYIYVSIHGAGEIVDVELINTIDNTSFTFDIGEGVTILPVNLTSGTWNVLLTMINGDSYFGCITVTSIVR